MLTILHTESSEGWGGQEIRIFQESLGMRKRGHRVLLAAPETSRIFARATEAGFEVFPARFGKKNPLSVMRMRSLIERERVDIVNTHSSSDSWVATVASRLASPRPRIIRTRHLSTPISRSILSRLIYDTLPDSVMTTGEEIRQRMITHNGFNASKIFSIPTGIDTGRFDPSRVSPAFRAKGCAIGMVGVLRSWKGHRYFIEAVPLITEKIPDARFYLAGGGPQLENITRMLKEFSLEERVVMLGHREDVPEVLASLDVVVHPSYANEGVPQSILQAMSMERPVVGSDAGAIKEVVLDGQTGFLIEPKNPKEIAEKVVRLCKDPALRREFGKNARLFVQEKHSFEGMLDRIEDLYGRLLRSDARNEGKARPVAR